MIKNNKGFTLVEMVITVVMMAVLMAVIVPVSMNYITDTQDNQLIAEGENIIAVAQTQIERLSLSGQLVNDSNAHSMPETSLMTIEDKAQVQEQGTLTKLVYQNNKVIEMEYVVGSKTVLYDATNDRVYIQ